MSQRRLIIMRHATAGWSAQDLDRPLTRGGVEGAAGVGAAIAAAGWSPAQIYSSSARRTRDTVAAMASEWSATEAEFLDQLYLAEVSTLRSVIASASTDGVLLLVAHNPGCSDVVASLTGESVPFAPGTAALLQCEAQDWNSAAAPDVTWSIAQVISC
ncbi:MAG: histidine phosphatase family protein [Planctomycetota bacterium]